MSRSPSTVVTAFTALAALLAALLLVARPAAAAGTADAEAADAEAADSAAADPLQVDFARSVYLGSATRVAPALPRPRAVVVLRVRLTEAGAFAAEVLRADLPAFTEAALASVARLKAPLGLSDEARARLRAEGLVEAWLFGDDGRFLLKTLANTPRGA